MSIRPLGVAAGLVLIKITHIAILDPIAAILVALLIVKEAWNLTTNAFGPLLDTCLPEEDEQKIKEIIERFSEEMVEYHSLRTRKSGHYKYVDLHLTVIGQQTVTEAHHLCDQIEECVNQEINNCVISIHIEPAESIENN